MSLFEKLPTLDCQLVAIDRAIFSDAVEMVVVPAVHGALGILPNHAPIATLLQLGIVEIYQDKKITQQIFISSGYASVTEAKCIILCDEAIPITDIQPEEVEAYIQHIQAELAKQALPPEEKSTLGHDLAIARAKMELFRQLMKH